MSPASRIHSSLVTVAHPYIRIASVIIEPYYHFVHMFYVKQIWCDSLWTRHMQTSALTYANVASHYCATMIHVILHTTLHMHVAMYKQRNPHVDYGTIHNYSWEFIADSLPTGPMETKEHFMSAHEKHEHNDMWRRRSAACDDQRYLIGVEAATASVVWFV